MVIIWKLFLKTSFIVNILRGDKIRKPERQEIENAEKIIVDILKKKRISPDQKKNKWINHCFKLAEVIRKDFPEIQEVIHIGNIYHGEEVGDIKLLLKNNPNWIYIEIKMSESKKSKGTLANISQDALTTSKLFKSNDILSWSKFREKNDFNQTILNILNRYKDYPNKLNKGTVDQQKIAKGAYLKKLFCNFTGIKKNISNVACKYANVPKIKEIALIICDIIKKAKEDKINYLKYLSQFKQNKENLKKFIIAMLIGYHTKEQLSYILKIPYEKILKILEKYYVYYTNEISGNIKISKDNVGNEVREIITKDVKIIFPEKQTNCIVQSNGLNLLRIVLHWKNKFQGIQTPCLNIFKEI
ncbi:MAG: hypothetical protein ACTSO4_13670 [Promethearchaeota archaeon]